MREIWLPIKDYVGLYEVSNFGNVRSLGNGGSNSKERILRPSEVWGYLQVVLYKNGKPKHFRVHRLVAEAFLPNWFDDTQVNHIDENKKNNHVDNLEWCDAKYNTNYGTGIYRMIEKQRNGKLSKPVLQFTKTGEFVKEWPSTSEAGRNGFDKSTICHCCNGKRKYYKGYIWKFK